MFVYKRDPNADGVGVAFTSAALDLSDGVDADARTAAFDLLSDAVGAPIAIVRQVHGVRVLDVDAPAARGLVDLTREGADALVTSQRGLALAVRVADCVPVLFADSAAGLVAAAHAGRAGLAQGVLSATVEALRGRGASSVVAWIGPHICGSCYEVPDGLAADFADATGVAPSRTAWGTTAIDLGAATRLQLDALGVPSSRHGGCTLTDAALHSFRRDGASSGRMAGLVWLA